MYYVLSVAFLPTHLDFSFSFLGSSFSITEMMGILLAQCVFETDSKARELLGACLGEIGAIDGHRLGTISMSDVLVASDPLASKDSGWRLSRPPWKSEQNRYELQLVTHHLVVAMKAAPTSSDQHKIAFSIQQMLQLLDNSAQKKKASTEEDQTSANAQEMSTWLKGQLSQAGVLDVVEPFWSSKFGEKVSVQYTPQSQGLHATARLTEKCTLTRCVITLLHLAG